MVTAPISKEAVQAVNLAGYAYAGHTGMLAALTRSPDSCMMLAHGAFRVSHVSTHVPLRNEPDLVTPKRISRVLEFTLGVLARLQIKSRASRWRRLTRTPASVACSVTRMPMSLCQQ